MTIKVGDRLPAGTLSEFIEVEGNGCTSGPTSSRSTIWSRARRS